MASGDGRSSGWRVALTVVLALLFSLVPLPAVIAPYRPNLLLLFVIYWALRAPSVAGLFFAWLCGLAVDLLTGTLLGQHAVAFLLVAFMTHKQQLRMRVFPIYHQTLTVFTLLAVYEFLIFWIDGIIGQEVTTWQRWLPVVTGAVFWPIIVAMLDTWNRRNR
jgi:rod shape-determining protein MreD